MNKQYLSLSISRALAIEYPIGDPFGGPAYGERNMPFIVGPAIGAAATSIGVAAAGATLATVGAAALTTVTAIGAVATVAGLAMSVIGMATGDKSLMKIGMYVGLAGGVAGLATWGASAGLSAASTEFGAATSAAKSAQASAGADSALGGITNAGDAFTAGKSVGSTLIPNVSTAGNSLASATSAALDNGTSNLASKAIDSSSTNLISKAPSLASTETSLGGGSGLLGQAPSATNTIGSQVSSAITPTMNGAAKGAVDAGNYFSKADALTAAGTALSGLYKGFADQNYNKIVQQQNQFNQNSTLYGINNLSHPAGWNQAAQPLTAEQLQAARINNAQQANTVAKALTA